MLVREKYRKPVRGQKVEELKLVEVDRVEKQKVEKILNKRKVQEVNKYLVRWKGFIVENDIWEREKDLENVRKLVDKFEGRLETKVRQQEGIDKMWKLKLNPNVKEFRRSKLLEKYIVKILFRQDDKKFEDEYLKKLEKSWERWKEKIVGKEEVSFSRVGILKGG